MILDSSASERSAPTDRFARDHDWEVSSQGFVYIEGVAAGQESLVHFLGLLRDGLPSASNQLKGTYFVALRNRHSGDQYCFIDPGGMFQAFRSSCRVSTSFLELVKLERLGIGSLQPEAIVDFLHYGYLSFGDTFFSQIRRLCPETIVCFRAGESGLETMSRCLQPIDATHSEDFLRLLCRFAGSVRTEVISLDLTGGIDSRLLAVALQELGVPFEAALSGTPGHQDLEIAKEVADLLQLQLFTTYHDVRSFEDTLMNVFAACDGLFDIAKAHRLYQLQNARRERGVSLALSGAGGELFKDFWWLQDFPRYAKRRSNLRRLYATRIRPASLQHNFLRHPYRRLSETCDLRFVEKLTPYLEDSNTRTYDRIYYELKMRDVAGRFLSNHLPIVPCYAPYLERSLASLGYTLPRSERAFARFHRRLITELNPAAARIRTTEGGLSVSSSPRDVLLDIPKYVFDKGRRLFKKVGRKAFTNARSDPGPNHLALHSHVMDLLRSRQTLAKLNDVGIVDGNLRAEDIRPEYAGSLLSLDLLLEYLTIGPNDRREQAVLLRRPGFCYQGQVPEEAPYS